MLPELITVTINCNLVFFTGGTTAEKFGEILYIDIANIYYLCENKTKLHEIIKNFKYSDIK